MGITLGLIIRTYMYNMYYTPVSIPLSPPLLPILPAVGMAFDEELCLDRGILKILFGDENTDDKSNPWRKMAIVSEPTRSA